MTDLTEAKTPDEILLEALCQADAKLGALEDDPPQWTAKEIVDVCMLVASEHGLSIPETAYLITTRLLDEKPDPLGSDWACSIAARALEAVPKTDPYFWFCDTLAPVLYAVHEH